MHGTDRIPANGSDIMRVSGIPPALVRVLFRRAYPCLEAMSQANSTKQPFVPRDLILGREPGVPNLQLRRALARAIAAGRWRPGERIPTEDELTQATGLSLGTVQRSLRLLADDGLVLRRHGTGTFVAESGRPMNAPFYHCRFLDDEGRGLLPIYSKVIARRPARGEGAWSQHVRGADVLRIERLFSINKEFNIYTHLYIDAARFPSLAELPKIRLNGVNFKDLLARDYHLDFARFAENLAIAVFPPAVCKAIGVKRGTSGAVLEIVAYDRQGEAVYFQDLLISPNPRRLFVA